MSARSSLLAAIVARAVPLVWLARQSDGAWLALLAALLGADPGDRCRDRRSSTAPSRAAFGATILPGLELRDGVPAQLRTLVVVPTLLTTREALEEQIERLEVHYLAERRTATCTFALLLGLGRCRRRRRVEGDDALLAAAAAGIARLNRAPRAGRRRRRASSCCTAAASGTTGEGAGWAGSASAASCTS